MSYRSRKENGSFRTGSDVDNLLNKIEDLGNATSVKDGIMSKNDKRKLDVGVADEEMSIEEIESLLNF